MDLYLKGTVKDDLTCLILKLTCEILDLYADSERELIEEYLNSINFSDEKVYTKIMQYKGYNDKFAEHQWWERLTKSKRDILKRFLKHSAFTPAPAELLGLLALLVHGFKIGTLHKMIGMWITEVSIIDSGGRETTDYYRKPTLRTPSYHSDMER